MTLVSEEVGLQSHSELRPTEAKLTSYTGHDIPVLGETIAEVRYNGTNKMLPLQVVSGKAPALLGRNWLHELKLDWKEIVGSIKYQKLDLEKLMKKHATLFEETCGKFLNAKAKLVLQKDAKPSFQRARPVPYNLQDAVEAELKSWEEMGIIERIAKDKPTPEWATPLVIVPKPNNKVRLCADFRVTVNPNIVEERYPLPKIEDILATIGPIEYASVIDLSQAYLQMELTNESKELCAINTHIGLFKMNRLPYGISAAPSIFQREMDHVLSGIDGVKCLLDDILVTGRSMEEHLTRLDIVMSRLRDAELKLGKETTKSRN